MRLILCIMLLLLSTVGRAQNPIISGQYTADPTARVFGDRLYLYPSHDIISPVEPERRWFAMADYHVFSTADLTRWTDHGVIVSQEQVPWVEPESYAMWAPDCVENNGTYYFYFPSQPKGTKGFGVGVATAQSPTGPFRPMWKPIDGIQGIDPCVMKATDGTHYIFWAGGGNIMAAPLRDDMMELADTARLVTGLPDGFKEGPFAFERDGRYYLTFPWVRKKNGTETLAYAMSSSPMGPWEMKGVIMDEWENRCWTNHHSIVNYRGQWYLFYHHDDYSPTFDKNRSVCVDSLTFNADGTIRPVRPTLRGVGITAARSHIQIDRYSAIGGGATTARLNPQQPFDGWKTMLKGKGSWVRYNRVDFADQAVSNMSVGVVASKGATLVVREDGPRGRVIATAQVGKGAGICTVPVDYAPRGIHDLYIALTGGGQTEIDWVGFDAMAWRGEGAFSNHRYNNVLAMLGYDEKEVERKVDEAFQQLFFGPDKIYFEVGDSMAYVSDIKNNDVRTEGMSYGMMVAVQLNRKDIFDRLWRWCQRYMQHHDGQRKGYFAWSCKTDGTRNSDGAASDGELYYVTSLIFASNRWGNNTGINYLAEARHIIDCSMQKSGMDQVAPLINLEHQLITFTPDPWGGRFTDPSYHVPAFYEVWARWLDDGRSRFWRECAARSREYLHRSIHPTTGLNPDYNNFDGTLMHTGRTIGDAFRYDSWRVPMNMALDYVWSGCDGEWQRQYADRLLAFLYSQGIDTFVDQYNIDGTLPDDILGAGGYRTLRHSLGLVATSATLALITSSNMSREFVDRLWRAEHKPYEDGYFDAYFDGLMRLFALMHLSGKYRIIEPGM